MSSAAPVPDAGAGAGAGAREDGPVDASTVDLLLSGVGRSLLLALPPYDESGAFALSAALREAGYAPELVAAALTQSRLRSRARDKLGEFADGMLLTPDGLEQATRFDLAARHAQRYREAGLTRVLDLGCGIGADGMAFAALGLAVDAVDADPATAAIAAHNLRHFPAAHARTGLAQEVLAGPTPGGDTGAWFDPARRTPGRTDATGRTRRTFRLDAMEPPFEVVLDVAKLVPATGAKLSPAFPHGAVPEGAEAQWTSRHGELLECALWWGPLAAVRGRSARIVGGAADVVVTEGDAAGAPPPGGTAPRPGDLLHEADRALVRAGLVGALALATGGVELAPDTGYVGGPDSDPDGRRVLAAARDAGGRSHRVVEALPAQVKPVRAWLRAHGIGRLTLKKRGVATDPDAFRRGLRLSGRDAHATAVLTRAGDRPVFLVVEPVDAPQDVTSSGPGTDPHP